MFKKIFAILLACLSLPFSLVACNDNNSKPPIACTVTFVQEGQENIVKTVGYGKELTNVPLPKEVVGHDVVWNVTDFSKITDDITVTAVATPKTYIIFYVLSEKYINDGAVLDVSSQEVTYGQTFTLIDLTYFSVSENKEYVLAYWKYNGSKFESGTYNFAHDIELVPAYFEPTFTPEWS